MVAATVRCALVFGGFLNLGNGMWHSGTLAAAKQAALLGCRGVASSTPTSGGETDLPRSRCRRG